MKKTILDEQKLQSLATIRQILDCEKKEEMLREE